MEELEQRVKRMDDELKRLGRGDRSSQQTTHNSITSQTATNSSEHPGPDRLTTRRIEGILPLDPSSPDEETPFADTETSDQPSYVLRSQDGKMRFFGQSILPSLESIS